MYLIRIMAMNGRGINGVGEIEFIVGNELLKELNSEREWIEVSVIADSSIMRCNTSCLDCAGRYIIYKSQIGFIREIHEDLTEAIATVKEFNRLYALKKKPNGSSSDNLRVSRFNNSIKELKKKITNGDY